MPGNPTAWGQTYKLIAKRSGEKAASTPPQKGAAGGDDDPLLSSSRPQPASGSPPLKAPSSHRSPSGRPFPPCPARRHGACGQRPPSSRPAPRGTMEAAAVLRVQRKRGGPEPAGALLLACKRPRTEPGGAPEVEKSLFKLVATVSSKVEARLMQGALAGSLSGTAAARSCACLRCLGLGSRLRAGVCQLGVLGLSYAAVATSLFFSWSCFSQARV